MSEFTVAVVGAGPSGIFTTAGILGALPQAQVDVFDKSMTPYGLVRYGVAPDHHKIKSVTRALSRIMESPRVRFFGHVTVGDDRAGQGLGVDELRDRYHAVVFATGAPSPRRLEIPGSELPGSCTAADIIPWYNGYPDVEAPSTRPARTAVVLGAGNVALDVGRVLLKGADGLVDTDVPRQVLDQFRTLDTRDVHIIARRGPRQVKFGMPELRGLETVDDLDLVVDPEAFGHDTGACEDPSSRSYDLLQEWSTRRCTGASRRLHLHFDLQATRILGSEWAEGVELSQHGHHSPSRSIPAGLVVAAIGYRGRALSGLPFDPARGTIPNVSGRVVPGLYVAGWIKRGPQGVIGTNKLDASETVSTLVADAPGLARPRRLDRIADVMVERRIPFVIWSDWLTLDADEIAQGIAAGTQRVKSNDRRYLMELVS